ncbi:MAG: GGDEF domain-containing protein [Curvibacter sp. PD_MW3]|nr:MAG: GGDEF domain-containing protein [Curvibacter sp. PD_MW3]
MTIVDPRTVVLLASIMTALMAMVLFFQWRNFPDAIRGLGNWTAAPLALCSTTLLGALRGDLPDLLTIAIPNMLLFVGLYLAYLGSQRFLNQPTAVRPWSAFIALMSVPVLWFSLIEPDFRTRLLVVSPPLGLLFALHAYLIYRHASRSFARLLLLAALVCGALNQLLRIVIIGLLPAQHTAFDPTTPHPVFLMVYVLITLLMSVSFVLMVSERLRAESQNLSAHDAQTGAYTQRHMNEACQQELARSKRQGHTMALLLIDLDHVEPNPKTYGPQRSAQALADFVTHTKALLRQPDLLGRFDSEAFMLLLPETPLNEALLVAERIRALVDQPGAVPHSSVSIGVTTNRLDHDTLDTLLARADKALCHAKDKGRNRVESA